MTQKKQRRSQRAEELTDWIQAVGRWKSRNRRLKDLLWGVRRLLREREEKIEEALWMRAIADNRAQSEEADDALSEAVAMAQKEHERALKTLAELYRRLDESHVERLFEPPPIAESTPVDDTVGEAGRESFPASDPPSFNPGRA